MMLLALFGGMALLRFGMQLAGEGLQRVAGGRLRQILTRLTQRRPLAVVVGATVTALMQSSSATTISSGRSSSISRDSRPRRSLLT